MILNGIIVEEFGNEYRLSLPTGCPIAHILMPPISNGMANYKPLDIITKVIASCWGVSTAKKTTNHG